MVDTHHITIKFGKHKGERWTRIPVSYLRWILNNHEFNGRYERKIAEAEWKRRGAVMPDIEVSGHAIDRASMRCLAVWEGDRLSNEGLHTWLMRVSKEAMKLGSVVGEKIEYKGMRFVFVQGVEFQCLKTVMRMK